MATAKYQYALDENGRLVSIKQAYLERNDGHTYHCLGCGAGLIARLGEVRTWHFAHRGDEDHCGTETYLHQLAKRRIKEKFEKGLSFPVGYYRDVRCSDLGTCPFGREDECHKYNLETFDLKQYYDTCREEQSIGGYIADLCLTNSSKPDREPVLIEIQVSHKSTPQKRDSGLRILEIRLRTEEDIDSLLSDTIVENPDARYGHYRDVDTIGFAKFYGFNKKSSKPEPLEIRSIQRFYLFRSGKAYVTNMDEFKSCRKVMVKDKKNAIFEASIDCFYLGSPSPYDFGYVAARQNGIDVKTCQLCKYYKSGYDQPICCLYKKCGTPKNPEPPYAKNCDFYRENKALMEEIRNSMPPIVVASASNIAKP
ncbi:MAG: hypothetical protein IJ161_11580 [Bacteroidales bacterium]|nr:hypothetical protein [Bacteroidales bacterium]